jgi:hypothetical protein
MPVHTGTAELFGDITPPGATLKRQMRLRPTGQVLRHPIGQMLPIRPGDAAPPQLPRAGVEAVVII